MTLVSMDNHNSHSCSVIYWFTLIITGFLFIQLHAQEVKEWRGEKRDGIYNNPKLLESWPQDGPPLLFTIKDLGTGHSSPVVTENEIIVTGIIEKKKGFLFCFDHQGTLKWKTNYGPEWNRDYPGVRGTPTIDGNRIYLESSMGLVICFDRNTGKPIWTIDMTKSLTAKLPRWGHNESILIHGNMLFCTPGGKKVTVAALDKNTGKTLWKSFAGGEKSGYCSPLLVSHNNKTLVVTMLGKSIIGVDANTGKLLWQEAHRTSYGVNPNTPVYTQGAIVYYSGYGQGAAKLQLSPDGMSIKKVWSNSKFDIQIGGAVMLDNYLYGSGHNNPSWHCLDIATGEIKYSTNLIGRGCIIAANSLLYCYSERGTFSLLKPAPDSFKLISSFRVKKGSGPHWAHPVIAMGKLFIRHGDVMMVYNISK